MSTRDRILDAAAHLMGTIGLARTTTREIAREAGFSEAMLYKLFRSKEELFLAVLSERTPGLVPLLRDLPQRAGQGTVRANLERVAVAALGFYRASLPMSASLFAEPTLLTAHRAFLRRVGVGPQVANDRVTVYLRAEQDLGRISAEADLAAVAQMLLGACLQYAFLSHFTDELPWPTPQRCAEAITAALDPLLRARR